MIGPEALALVSPGMLTRYSDQPTAGDWARVLTTFSLFSGVSRRRLRQVARQATFADFAPGDIVLQKGGGGDSLYLILSGTARALETPVPRALRSGDYFGELALFAGHPRSLTVVATRELHVMMLPRSSFIRLARQHPTITLTMMKNLSTQLPALRMHAARP
jgi:CRP-like cAMP-binding protein